MLRIVDDTPGSIEEFLTLDNWSRAALGALQEGATHLMFEVAQSATQRSLLDSECPRLGGGFDAEKR